jgi:hypothetical protein
MDDFGFVREYPPDVSNKMRESLRRAIEINPEYPESYRMLAFVLMIGNEDLNEAIALLKKGMAYQPGNQQYELLMAQIYLRQEKFAEAKSIVDRLAKTAEDEQMRSSAEQIANTIAQYNEAKKNSEMVIAVEGAPRLNKPVFIKRDSLTDEQFAKMERDREIRNLNNVIEKLKDGEKRVVGSIEKISCVKEGVLFDVAADGGKIALTSRDFQSLDLTILHEGTNDVSVGCDADIKNELIVITYKPDGNKNTLTALNFVPADFRLMTEAEIASAPNIIVQGGPPSDLGKNARIVSEQMAEFEKKRDQMMIQQMERSMRKPLEGETRLIGSIEKVECSSKDVSFLIRTTTAVLKFKAPSPSEMKIVSYTPDAGGLSFGCGVSYPTLPAVVTYRANQDKKGKDAGNLVALEFVPRAYQLPAEN